MSVRVRRPASTESKDPEGAALKNVDGRSVGGLTETSIGVEPRGLGGRQVEALVVRLFEHKSLPGDTQDPCG